MMRWIVMRYASLMEDEGRPQYMGAFESQEKAEEFIALEVHRQKGYFSAGHYVAMEMPPW